MNKLIIAVIVFIGLVAVSLVHGCDLMKDTKNEQAALTGFFTKHCAKGDLEQAEIDKLVGCYGGHIKALLVVFDPCKKADKFLNTTVFPHKDLPTCCHNKKLQDELKKCGMKEVGMKDGMACYKKIGTKCDDVKKSIGTMAGCLGVELPAE